jgi:hypothetical protein
LNTDGDQFRDVADCVVPVVSEAAMAKHLQQRGRRVTVHRGRYWTQTRPGFFRPVHPLARLTAQQATRPAWGCWGFQACLAEDDVYYANGTLPAYLISEFDSFQEDQLSGSRRYKLRRSRKHARLVELTGDALLREQGYDVLQSSRSRTGFATLPTREQYLADLEGFTQPAAGVVLAGLVDGKLGGYITGYAVDGTAYVNEVVISTDALRTNMSTGLTYEFMFACARSTNIREMMHGLHVPEDDGLTRYKEWMGLPLLRLPSRVAMLPGAAPVIRARSPHKYYRLTGKT